MNLKFTSKVYNALGGNRRKLRGKNNKINSDFAFLRKVRIEVRGNGNQIFIHRRARVSNVTISIFGNGHTLSIGPNCSIDKGSFWFEDAGCRIDVGGRTTIGDAHIAVTEPRSTISIGEDCMFSSHIDIRNGDSHSIIDVNSGKRINYARDIQIGNHVWLGVYAQVLKGAKIGDNSIVGTHSVVSGDIPSNCVAGGIPAKVLREGVTWDRKRIYQQT